MIFLTGWDLFDRIVRAEESGYLDLDEPVVFIDADTDPKLAERRVKLLAEQRSRKKICLFPFGNVDAAREKAIQTALFLSIVVGVDHPDMEITVVPAFKRTATQEKSEGRGQGEDTEGEAEED